MNLAYFASDQIAVPILDHIINNQLAEVVLIVTKPNQQAKRGLKLNPTPVKEYALNKNIEISTKEPNLALLTEKGIDVILVFAYGMFINENIFNGFPTINIHPSLLPKYRGPSPIQTALLNGDSTTGVSFFFIDKDMDSGDIIVQENIVIDINDNYQSLAKKIIKTSTEMCTQLFQQDIEKWQTQKIKQDSKKATFCQKINKEDSRIIPGESPNSIHNKVRSIGGFIEKTGIRFKIIETKLTESGLELTKVQLPGKNIISYKDFLNSNQPINIGEILP